MPKSKRITKVRVNATLKAGDVIFNAGKEYSDPIPKVLLEELAGGGVLENGKPLVQDITPVGPTQEEVDAELAALKAAVDAEAEEKVKLEIEAEEKAKIDAEAEETLRLEKEAVIKAEAEQVEADKLKAAADELKANADKPAVDEKKTGETAKAPKPALKTRR